MSYLLDVNVLVAWGWRDHLDHSRTASWIASQKIQRGVYLYTSPIPEIGFIRVSVQRAYGTVSVREASDVLRGMLDSLGKRHRFLPDDLNVSDWPLWCVTPSRTTDAHLFQLASRHRLRLLSLDTGIPGAKIIP